MTFEGGGNANSNSNSKQTSSNNSNGNTGSGTSSSDLTPAWAAVGREREVRRTTSAQSSLHPPSSSNNSMFEARRLSLSGDSKSAPTSPKPASRRASLAGIHAVQAANEPRLSTATIADLTSTLGAGSRRLSLAEKIQKIKADANIVPGSEIQTNSSPNLSRAHHPPASPLYPSAFEEAVHIGEDANNITGDINNNSSNENDDTAGAKSSLNGLLGPSFFATKAPSPKGSPKGDQRPRRGSVPAANLQNIIRVPDGPDGSRGFGSRRNSLVN